MTIYHLILGVSILLFILAYFAYITDTPKQQNNKRRIKTA